MSLSRAVSNFRQLGWRAYLRGMLYITDPKVGRFAGKDQHGNKYYENFNEMQYRHRWVDYVNHDYNASQVPPEWHSWLSHIREKAPPDDEIMQSMKQTWQGPHFENLTGTRGAFKTYSTTKPKVFGWEPQVAQRVDGPEK